MSLRKCEFDQLQAKYVCTTHNGYYCQNHFDQHISDRNPHISTKVENVLSLLDFAKLQNEVNSRIDNLQHGKIQVASIAAQLIANIGQACLTSIKLLDLEIESYRDLIQDNNFDDKTLLKATKILSTRLQIQIDNQLTLNLQELATESSIEIFSNQLTRK
jgi:hypothetical protein